MGVAKRRKTLNKINWTYNSNNLEAKYFMEIAKTAIFIDCKYPHIICINSDNNSEIVKQYINLIEKNMDATKIKEAKMKFPFVVITESNFYPGTCFITNLKKCKSGEYTYDYTPAIALTLKNAILGSDLTIKEFEYIDKSILENIKNIVTCYVSAYTCSLKSNNI